jgi:disulfide bond formation protein DsbB
MRGPEPRLLFALASAIPLLLVGFAAALTVLGNVAACPLCIVQRMIYLLIALVALIGYSRSNSAPCRTVMAFLIGVFSLSGAAIAGYQIYLQLHPFVATCGDGSAWWERMVESAGQAMPMLFKAEGLCSDSRWTMLGLSIVVWSLLAYLGLFLIGLLASFVRPKSAG